MVQTPCDPVESFKKLKKILAFLDKEGKEIILIGDTNCDLSNSEDNNTKHMFELYNLSSLKQLMEEPTRENLSSSTLIDHIATSSPSNIFESGVLQISMSDHFLVFCIRKFNASLQKEHKMIKSRRMKNFNEQAFLGDVAAISWEQEIGNSDDVNVLASNWSNLFTRIIEKHAPMRQKIGTLWGCAKNFGACEMLGQELAC